jgi:hypothetical protein
MINLILGRMGVVDTEMFWLGWHRRSMIILDNAGCPMWLNRWRCKPPKGWGAMLGKLLDERHLGE